LCPQLHTPNKKFNKLEREREREREREMLHIIRNKDNKKELV